MLPKPDLCRACPLWQTGKGWVPDEIVEDAPVFILAQNPGQEEEAAGKPMVGKTGQYQEAAFFPVAGLERGINVSIGNVLRCRWQRSNTLPPEPTLTEAIACCKQHLKIPKSVRLVVAEGALAWRALGGTGSVTEWRGQLKTTVS